MKRDRRIRIVVAAAASAAALLGLAACVDLFHTTDFGTLCSSDPTACAPDASTDGQLSPDVSFDAPPPAPIDVCAASSAKARELAERACGFLGACLGTLEDSRFGTCMMRALAAYDCAFNPSLRPRDQLAVQWDCLSKVSDCEAVEACIYGKREGTKCTPKTGGTYTACDPPDGGIVMAECGNSEVPLGISPCALHGRSCARVDGSKSICAGKRGAACTGNPRCESTFAVSCKSAGGIESDEGRDCTAVGDGRCVSDRDGVACAPPADAGACGIATTSRVACSDKHVAESCVDGKAVKINCAVLGQGCVAGTASSVEPSTACTNMDAGTSCNTAEDDCDGSGILVSCAQGTEFQLRCNKLGLGSCEKAAGRQARCTVP
jgi:hypothetical protein